MKIGLALGGGGVRGAAHIGVLYELARIGIKPDIVAGTSSGGLVGALYAAGATLDEMEALARGLTWRSVASRRLPFGRIKRTLFQSFKQHFDGRTFESLPIPLRVNAFDPLTGQIVIFDKGPILPALRATIALPGFLPPAKTDEYPVLIDCGLVSALPTKALHDVDAMIAVDVGSDDVATKPPRGLIRRRQWAYERAYSALYRLNSAQDRARATLVISPEVNDVQTFEFSQIDRCIEAGRRAARIQGDTLQELVD